MEGGVRSFVWDVMERGDWPRGIFQENLQSKIYISVKFEERHSWHTKSHSTLYEPVPLCPLSSAVYFCTGIFELQPK